jgi:integrase-like protein
MMAVLIEPSDLVFPRRRHLRGAVRTRRVEPRSRRPIAERLMPATPADLAALHRLAGEIGAVVPSPLNGAQALDVARRWERRRLNAETLPTAWGRISCSAPRRATTCRATRSATSSTPRCVLPGSGTCATRAPSDDNPSGVLRDDPLVPYDLRHTFGTLAVRRNPLTDVQAWMGHRSITTTMRYVHYVPQHDAAARLTAAFAPEDAGTETGTELPTSGRN